MIKLYFLRIDNAQTYSEIFARKILGEHLNIESSSIAISKNEFGKPYLRDYPNTYYNISHTKGAIVCVISDQEVGIDIERIGRFNKRIVERFFTKNEQNYIFKSQEGQDRRFIKVWTMKEAYVKWIGKGTEIPFESFDVLNEDNICSVRINKLYISICSNEIKNDEGYKPYFIEDGGHRNPSIKAYIVAYEET